jgi:hypothetical protein
VISQHGHLVAVSVLASFVHDIDVRDGRPMNAYEPTLVERGVHGREETAMHVQTFIPGVQFPVHSVRFDPTDLLDRPPSHTMRSFHHNPIELRSLR